MTVKPMDNLKGFAINRPPLIIFLVCLLFFAIALISLGLYIKSDNIQNFEAVDWNAFLEDFSREQFCLATNKTVEHQPTGTTANPVTLNSTAMSVTGEAGSSEENLHVEHKNVSFSVAVSFQVQDADAELHNGLASLSSLSSNVPSQNLLVESKIKSKNVAVTFDLTEQPLPCEVGGSCQSKEFIIGACLTLAAPPSAFPTFRHPKACNRTTSRTYSSSSMSIKPKEVGAGEEWCKKGIIVNTKFDFDPNLTLMLSEAEKNIINLHLMYTSYFLFVMLITCVFYALIKGPPLKQRVIHSTGSNKKVVPI